MFKLICVLAFGILLGAVLNKFIPKIDINIKINQNEAFPYEIEKTKAGEPCGIVEKWGPPDCFLDVDTQEYKLEDYTKSDSYSEYKERYVFFSRAASAECVRFQYNRRCVYPDSRANLKCYAAGRCIETKWEATMWICLIVATIVALLYFLYVMINN